jgi:hypothetical protein
MKWVDREFYVLRAVGNGIVFVMVAIADTIQHWSLRQRAKRSWHRWYAWRPVSLPEFSSDGVVVPRHYVWLEYVDRKRRWFRRLYRPNTLPAGMYEYKTYDHSKNDWEIKIRPLQQIEFHWRVEV